MSSGSRAVFNPGIVDVGDFNGPRLGCLRHCTRQINRQEAIMQICFGHVDMVCQAELPLKCALSDALI